jgi:mono/diheme cytochrome c family protein
MKRLAGALVAIAILLTGCSESTDGAVLYRKYCAACHGSDLSGGVGPSLGAGSEAAASTDAEYRIVIREGLNDMPAVGGLDDLRADAVVSYIRQVQGE